MIPEVKVNHWKWCEVQGNSPHERWEWCEVNEEVDVYTALWLEENGIIETSDYIIELSKTEPIKKILIDICGDKAYWKGQITEYGYDIMLGLLLGISLDRKYDIDEKLYTNEND